MALDLSDPLLTHAREFTNIEVEGLTVWFDLDQAGNDALARSVLDASLMVEHYTSLLPHAAADRSAQQNANQAELARIANGQLQAGRAALTGAKGA